MLAEIGGMRYTNSLRHALLQHELQLVTTLTIFDNVAVEAIQNFLCAKFHTDITDKKLDNPINQGQEDKLVVIFEGNQLEPNRTSNGK